MADATEADVFEIIDFTNASEWESLVAEIEKTIRRWGLELGSSGSDAQRASGSRNEGLLQMRGREYRLSHIKSARTDATAKVAPASRQYKEIAAAFKASGFEAPPQWTTPVLSTANDFAEPDQHGAPHPVTMWFGLDEFLVVNPAESKSVLPLPRRLQFAERVCRLRSGAEKLSGGVFVLPLAVGYGVAEGSTSHCLTQLDNGARTNYRGCAVAAGMHTAFTSVSMSTVPRAYANLSGLIALFRSKLPGIDRHERVAIGAKFTYTLPNWFDDWMPPVAPTESSDIYGVAPQKALPVGALTDSIAEIRLFTVWPAFRENAVQDHAAYSELDPNLAPSWSLQARMREQDEEGLLSTTLRAFARLLDCQGSWADLRDGDGSAEGASTEEPEQQMRNDVLDRLQGPKGYEDKARGLVGTAIRKTLQQVETVADAARDAARRRSRRRDTSGRALSESDLDSLIWPRLFGTDDWVAGGDKSQAKQSSMKGCPSHSLLAELAVTMALATAHGGGPQAAATLWDEVIEDIEFNYWQDLLPIPRVSTLASPDMQHCIAHQKLEMINCCIRKQQARNELLRQRGIMCDRPPSSADTDSDEFHSAEEDTDGSPARIKNSDLHFYLAPEDEESLLQRGEGPTATKDPRTDASSSDDGEGVASVSPTLKLLGSGSPLRIPVTQSEGPMTEDMMERKLADMTQMGTSTAAAEARIQLQSMSLRSDMSAFKAANPKCCLEDFVRWHSPRDYIETEDGSGGVLSERMREPGNLWHQLWGESEACPVARQRALFDATKEALAAIKYLRTAPPPVIVQQLLPPLIMSAEAALSAKATLLLKGSAGPVLAEVEKITAIASGMGKGTIEDDVQRLRDVLLQVSTVEAMLGTAQSLLSRLGGDLDASIIANLAVGNTVPLLDSAHREAIRILFFDGGDEGVTSVDVREFVLRLVTRFPSKVSRPGINRMYAHVSDSNFTVASMFTEDRAFDA